MYLWHAHGKEICPKHYKNRNKDSNVGDAFSGRTKDQTVKWSSIIYNLQLGEGQGQSLETIRQLFRSASSFPANVISNGGVHFSCRGQVSVLCVAITTPSCFRSVKTLVQMELLVLFTSHFTHDKGCFCFLKRHELLFILSQLDNCERNKY